MATPVLIIGRSGTGKSTSLRNCVGNDNWNLIRVLDKPLPFKGKINGWYSDDYQQIMKLLIASKAKNIVIDDAGYLITNMFMNKHSSAGGGNGVFTLYNQIGDHFWNLLQFISTKVPADKIVYMIMHEESNELGEIKPKTIGKLLDEKVCVEGMFTIVLRCIAESNKHLFVTQKYVVSAKAVDGNQLYKSLCTIRDRYNVRFEFCEKKDTGKEIMRILSGGGGDPR